MLHYADSPVPILSINSCNSQRIYFYSVIRSCHRNWKPVFTNLRLWIWAIKLQQD